MDSEYFDLILVIALCNRCVLGIMTSAKHCLRYSSMTKSRNSQTGYRD